MSLGVEFGVGRGAAWVDWLTAYDLAVRSAVASGNGLDFDIFGRPRDTIQSNLYFVPSGAKAMNASPPPPYAIEGRQLNCQLFRVTTGYWLAFPLGATPLPKLRRSISWSP
jgi:hypothetical protein